MGFADFVTSALSNTIGTVLKVIVEVAKTIVTIGKILGIVDEDTNEVELGEELLQAEKEGLSLDDFSSREEYLKNAKNLEIDSEIKQISAEEKAKKSTEFISATIAERFPDISVENLIKCIGSHNDWFSSRSGFFGELLKANSGEANNVINYMLGNEKNSGNRENALNSLVDIEKKLNPNISDSDAVKNIQNARK